jgi:hypothetical protein
MPGFRSPLDAYREDLSRASGRKRLAADDEFWIILATGMRRLAQAPPRSRPAAARRLSTALTTFAEEFEKHDGPNARREPRASTGRPFGVADSLRHFPAPEHASTLVAEVRGTVADAEEAGGLLLAREMLTDLRLLAAHAPPVDQGLILIQLGRVARTLGELDVARDLYQAAGDLGRATGSRELEVREAVALAVLARTRGNHPAARELFQSALQGATDLSLTDVSGLAHHGLMAEAADAGDFDMALRHGWQGLSAAREQGSREAEMLINLAEICARAGYDAAALGGFAAAMARTAIPRLRIPALAGTASAAGRLHDRARLAQAERAIVAEPTNAFPFEMSRAWLCIARAKRALGDAAAADAAAAKAAALAHAHGFYEITHRAEQELTPAKAPLSPAGLEVVQSLATWSRDASIDTALSSVSTG